MSARPDHDRRPDGACQYDDTIADLKAAVDRLTETAASRAAEIALCKADVNREIDTMRASVMSVQDDVSQMRDDMHMVTTAVSEIKVYMAEISGSLRAIADFPDTWTKIKGFWAVVGWLKSNWIVLAVLVGLLWVDLSAALKRLLP